MGTSKPKIKHDNKMEASNQNIKLECKPKNGVDSLEGEQLNDISFQMKNSICKIEVDKPKKIVGTGFFCIIPSSVDRLTSFTVLITCNHVLDDNNLAQGSEIKFTLDNENIKKSIVINNSRRIYTSKKKDITIIEIDHEKDNINFNAFLKVDDTIYKDDLNEQYQNKSVYVIHYQNGKTAKYSLGISTVISDDQKYDISHNCATEEGSSGSPIIKLKNYGVIGIHIGSLNNINRGNFLKIPIEEFNIKNKHIDKDVELTDMTLGKTNDSILNNKDRQSITKRSFSYQTKPEEGNFYVSKY